MQLKNVLIEKDSPLTNEDKNMFAYFGEGGKKDNALLS